MVKIQDTAGPAQILSAFDGHVATITLNRPDKKNAVTGAMWRRIAAIFAEISANTAVRAVIVRGAGPDFCAGADIAEFKELRRDTVTAREYEAGNDEAFAAIRDCPVPVIAAIRGVCFGGGFGIAAATDLRIAAPDAVFSVPAARLGLAYPVRAMADIVDSVGSQTAKYLTFTGNRFNAGQALAAGFLLEIADAALLDRRVAELASTIAENAPLSVRASKASIRAAVTGSKEDLARANALGRQTFDSSDYSEGRAAFADKRKPVFSGR